MPIYGKCTTGADIINGLATVANGTNTPSTYDPGEPYSQHWPSGDSLTQYVTLDGRYKLPPTGWNGA